MATKQFEHLQEASLARLRALVPAGCPLLVDREAAGGFRAHTWDEGDAQTGRFQVVAAFVAGYVAAWRRVRAQNEARWSATARANTVPTSEQQ